VRWLPAISMMLVSVISLPLAVVPRVDSFALAMALLFFAMFVAAGFIIGSLAYGNTYSSVKHAGLIAGLGAGSWSALVAVVIPGFGRLFRLAPIWRGVSGRKPGPRRWLSDLLDTKPEGSRN
jgi:hypothetical protein